MSVKFPMKGNDMQSLYALAWFNKPAPAGTSDSTYGGYHAGQTSAEIEAEGGADVHEVLDAPMAVSSVSTPTAQEVSWWRNRKREEAERVMHLVNLGFTDF